MCICPPPPRGCELLFKVQGSTTSFYPFVPLGAHDRLCTLREGIVVSVSRKNPLNVAVADG